MLRGRPNDTPSPTPPPAPPPAESGVPLVTEATDLPGLQRPYTAGERSAGVLFYQPKQGFWHPYHLLQRMEFTAEEVRLVFATEDVVLRGRGLHPLYVELARQTVWSVVEQGERYAALAETGTLITHIERQPHDAEEPPP